MSLYGGGIEPESGESRAHTYHWITSLDTFGTPDHSVRSSVRTYAVLSKNGARTYVAYNPAATQVTVSFSDGQTLVVPARATAWRGPAGSGTDAGSGSAPPTTPPPTTPPPTGSRDAYAAIQAESFDQQNGVVLYSGGDGGQHIGSIGNGDWALYRGVDFGTATARQFSAKVASGAAGGISGLVEVRIGSPTAAVAGSFAVANTGGWQS